MASRDGAASGVEESVDEAAGSSDNFCLLCRNPLEDPHDCCPEGCDEDAADGRQETAAIELFLGKPGHSQVLGPRGKELETRIYRAYMEDVQLDRIAMAPIEQRAADLGVLQHCRGCGGELRLGSITATTIGATFAGSRCSAVLLEFLQLDKEGAHYGAIRDSSACFSCTLLRCVRERLGADPAGSVPDDSTIRTIQERFMGENLTRKMCKAFQAAYQLVQAAERAVAAGHGTAAAHDRAQRLARAEEAGHDTTAAHKLAQQIARAVAAGHDTVAAHQLAQAVEAGYDTHAAHRAARLGDNAVAAGYLTAPQHQAANAARVAQGLGYVDQYERRRAGRLKQWMKEGGKQLSWIYRCVHPSGVDVQSEAEFDSARTGKRVVEGKLVGVVERRALATPDGVTSLKLFYRTHRSTPAGEGWVFIDESLSGAPLMKLVGEKQHGGAAQPEGEPAAAAAARPRGGAQSGNRLGKKTTREGR